MQFLNATLQTKVYKLTFRNLYNKYIQLYIDMYTIKPVMGKIFHRLDQSIQGSYVQNWLALKRANSISQKYLLYDMQALPLSQFYFFLSNQLKFLFVRLSRQQSIQQMLCKFWLGQASQASRQTESHLPISFGSFGCCARCSSFFGHCCQHRNRLLA